MCGELSRLLGIRVLTNPGLVVDGEPVRIKRTWWSRLTSRPWDPRRTHDVVVPKVPLKGAIEGPGGYVLMHPASAAALMEKLRRAGLG